MKNIEHYCKTKINFTGIVYVGLIIAAVAYKQY